MFCKTKLNIKKLVNFFRGSKRFKRILLKKFNLFRGGTLRSSLAGFAKAFQLALGLDNLNLAGHLDHGASVLHVAVSFSFERADVNHVAFLYRMAVRYLNWVGNLDGNAFGLGVTVAFGFPVLDLNDFAFWFAFRNIDGFGGINFDINTLLN